jgi:hypothetical protein
MTKYREKQLEVNALDLALELKQPGDEKWFLDEMKNLLFKCREELPLEWFTLLEGKPELVSIDDMKILGNSAILTLEFKAGFTEENRINSYDLPSFSFRLAEFFLEIDKSLGKVILRSQI